MDHTAVLRTLLICRAADFRTRHQHHTTDPGADQQIAHRFMPRPSLQDAFNEIGTDFESLNAGNQSHL